MLTAKKLVDTHRVGGGYARRSGKRGRCKNPEVLRMRRERIELEEVVGEDGVTYLDLTDRYDSPRVRSTRPNRSWDRKDFGENLNPLWRYLQKSVGRNWDSVYSELRSRMDPRGAVSGHIFQHLFDFVVTSENVALVDGKPHRKGWNGLRPITYKGKVGELWNFWVDPRDGKLKVGVKPELREREKNEKDRAEHFANSVRDLGNREWLCRDSASGLWYRVRYEPQVWHHYTKETSCWKRNPDGSIAWGHPREVYLQECKEALVTEAPRPGTLVLPKVDEDLVLVSCRSASKKDLKTHV